jgi:hypothetical protein
MFHLPQVSRDFSWWKFLIDNEGIPPSWARNWLQLCDLHGFWMACGKRWCCPTCPAAKFLSNDVSRFLSQFDTTTHWQIKGHPVLICYSTKTSGATRFASLSSCFIIKYTYSRLAPLLDTSTSVAQPTGWPSYRSKIHRVFEIDDKINKDQQWGILDLVIQALYHRFTKLEFS